MKIAVVVPTYARADALPHCLTGLTHQIRRADDVLLVVRAGDHATSAVAGAFASALPLRVIYVTEPGLVEALNAGLAAARSDVIVFTDDDAVARPDWLARIEAAFGDPQVGAVGGRDVIWSGGRISDPPVDFAARLRRHRARGPVVGRVGSFGRVTGNHHAGRGEARDSDILKGVNMAYRRRLVAAMGFDARVRGTGSQVHNEPSVCLPLRAAGWRVVYDPAILVDHYPAPRPAQDDRQLRDAARVYDKTFNETLSLWPYLHPRRRRWHVVWATAVGTIWSPGIAQVPRHIRRGDRRPWRIVLAAARGRRDAARLVRRGPTRRTPPSPAELEQQERDPPPERN